MVPFLDLGYKGRCGPEGPALVFIPHPGSIWQGSPAGGRVSGVLASVPEHLALDGLLQQPTLSVPPGS